MATNPPITIGPFANVPAPGSGVKSDWAQQISRYVSTRVGFRYRRTAVLSVPNSTLFTVQWDTETEDTDGFGAAPTTSPTVPAGKGGLYVVTLAMSFAGTPTGGFARLIVPGITTDIVVSQAGQQAGGTIVVPLAAGDAVVTQMFHSSGAAQNVTGQILGYWMGP